MLKVSSCRADYFTYLILSILIEKVANYLFTSFDFCIEIRPSAISLTSIFQFVAHGFDKLKLFLKAQPYNGMHHLFIKLFIAEEFRPCIGKSRAFVQSLSVILIGAIAIFGEIAVSIDNGAKYFLAEHGIILGVTYKCIMNSTDYGRWRERSSHWFTGLRFTP